MKKLATIQHQFADHIFNSENHQIAKSTIYSDVEALERIGIYRNNVFGNFESVLSSIYPVTRKLILEVLGEKKFSELLLKFYQKYPSISGDLNNFGSEFPQFIKYLKPTYLKDLAQVELLHHQSYFAAQTKDKFNLRKFKKLPPENFGNIIFTIDFSAILLKTKFAIFSIWQKQKPLKNCTKAEFIIVYRNKILRLTEEEYVFLELAKKRKPLYKIYQQLCKKSKKDIDIGALINDFVSRGIITKFDL